MDDVFSYGVAFIVLVGLMIPCRHLEPHRQFATLKNQQGASITYTWHPKMGLNQVKYFPIGLRIMAL